MSKILLDSSTRFVSQEKGMTFGTLTDDFTNFHARFSDFDFFPISFVTPLDFNRGPILNKWYKDLSSGRSFNFSQKRDNGEISSFISKGADLYDSKGKYRRFQNGDGCLVGMDFYNSLEVQFINSNIIQEAAQILLNRATYAPKSIWLTKISRVLDERGKEIDFKDYMYNVLKNYPEYRCGFIGSLIHILGEENFIDFGAERLDINSSIKLGRKRVPSFEIIEKYYLDEFFKYSTGSYFYSIKGYNTRLIEHKSLVNGKLERILSEQYPNMNSFQVLNEFMKRVAETLAVTWSADLSCKFDRSCLLINTTIGGCSVDNNYLGDGVNVEEISRELAKHNHMSRYFAQEILGFDNKFNFEDLFKKVFLGRIFDVIRSSELKKMIEQGYDKMDLDNCSLNRSFYMANRFHSRFTRTLLMSNPFTKKLASING